MTAFVRTLAAALLVLSGLSGAAQADPFGIIQFHTYKLENRPTVVFPPPPKGGSIHVSPYPASKRAAAVWDSDACWKACTGETSWRHDACVHELGKGVGIEACRSRLDTDNRVCLRSCRTRGGPMVNLAF
jgi:hypothetical protein